VVGATSPGTFVRGCGGFALGAALGLLAADMWIYSTMEASGVAPPRTFHAFYWIFFVSLVAVATFVHGLGRLAFRPRRGFFVASLTGLLSTLPLHLPRDAAYEAMCAPMCSGRQDAWMYVLAIAFAGAFLDRIGSGRTAPMNEDAASPPRSVSFWAGGAVALAILALPPFVLVYHAWYKRISMQQYAECLSLPVPTTLGFLDQRFGPGRRVQVLEHGQFKGYGDYRFESNPDYSFAWSTDIGATVVPGTGKVVALYCGEGW
jgi:hypothetical protein